MANDDYRWHTITPAQREQALRLEACLALDPYTEADAPDNQMRRKDKNGQTDRRDT